MFRRLPEEVKREVRAGWRADAEQDARLVELVKAHRRQAWIEGVVLIGGTECVVAGFSAGPLLLATAVGFGVGQAWWRTDAGQVLTPLIASVAYAAMQVVWLTAGASRVGALLLGSAFVACASAYLGLRREQRVVE